MKNIFLTDDFQNHATDGNTSQSEQNLLAVNLNYYIMKLLKVQSHFLNENPNKSTRVLLKMQSS